MVFYKATFFKRLFLIFLLSLKFSYTESIDEAIKTKCDGKTIKYSIYANLKEYIENENNIDNTKTYEKLADLKNSRIGIYKPTYADNEKLKSLFNRITEYDNKDNLVIDINRNRTDAGIIFCGLAKSISMNSNILFAFPETLYSVDLGFGLQKDNEELKNKINQFIKENKKDMEDLEFYWDLTNSESGYIDTNLSGSETLKVIAKIDSSPYCYLRQFDNAFIGVEVDLIYKFARENGYKLELTKAISYEEQYKALREKTADIAIGFFVIKENEEDISFSDVLYKGDINLIVRYSNLPASHAWTVPCDSPERFDGEKIGLQTGTIFDELIAKYFPNSEIVTEDLLSALTIDLLTDKIKGFLFDKPIAEYLSLKYSWRLAYFDLEDLTEYKNGFAFQKNEEGNVLLKEFNEFIKTLNLTQIYKKWIVADYESTEALPLDYNVSDYIIDKNLDPNWPLIKVGADLDNKPLSYYGQNDPKGIELDILYRFAKAKHYNIDLISIKSEERITYIKEGKANITLGAISITDERKKDVDFSDPLYDSPIVLIVLRYLKKDTSSIEIRDGQFETKPNPIIDVNVDFSGKIKNSSCIFPSFYNDEILINCTIDDISDVDTSKGFKYENTSDKIVLLYDYLEANNFLQANSKLEGHKIITESNKSQDVCPVNSPSFPPSKGNSTIDYQNKKSSSGLSTGGIIAIMIPCGLVLLAVTGFSLMNSSSGAAHPQNSLSEMETVNRQNLHSNNNLILQPQLVQPVQVVQDVNTIK